MLGQGFHTLSPMVWVPSNDWRFDSHAPASTLRTMDASWIGSLPVEPATLLGLELLQQEGSLDLGKASDLVLSDVGATLKIFGLAAAEYLCAGRPCRVPDILASVSVETWLAALSSPSTGSCRNLAEIRTAWQHCRLVGQYAKLISESLDGVCSDLAYVAGLLHEVETMPHVLDLHPGETTGESPMLMEAVLPHAVLDALQSARERGRSSVWRYVLSSAHALALAAPHTHIHA